MLELRRLGTHFETRKSPASSASACPARAEMLVPPLEAEMHGGAASEEHSYGKRTRTADRRRPGEPGATDLTMTGRPLE